MKAWVSLFVLGLLVVVSALGVVYCEHRNRTLFVDMQQQQRQLDELDFEWGRLQLEQSTWSTHGRIERLARERLGMKLPGRAEVEIIKP